MPQVYVRSSNVEVTGQGTLIAGNDVAFQAAQDIVNSGGTIAARKCNDPAKPAHIMRLKQTPQPASSFPTPDAVGGGYRS
ncbi:hypothetical protein [Herbaspirillum rubrisubalbicans]|uniref:hypothetical protein n=1 Tax=Herbaspirillum rubrisubalbicans TaxID=80842 RepID=UPI0034593CF7